MTSKFEDIVESLTEPDSGGLFVQKRDPRVRCLNVFAARNVSNSFEALLVQAEPHLLPPIDEWPQSEGFEVTLRPVDGQAGVATLVCLELTSSRFRDVFLSLAEDVCKTISVEVDGGSAIQEMLRRLYRWQEFMMRHRVDGLSPEQRVGLFGELVVLRDSFLEILEPAQAVQGWRGCKKANQDFQYPGFAVEVKTTQAVSPEKVRVSNIQQIDEEGIDEMFLSLVWIHKNEASGQSLPEIVAEIRSLLVEPALAKFDEGLMEVGYLDCHEALYEKELNQVRGVTMFSVRDDFPRLTHRMIPNGVSGVKYQINLEACRPYIVGSDAFSSAVTRLKGRL